MARVHFGAAALLLAMSAVSGDATVAGEQSDDYYYGFSQGVYYGLLLAGEDYQVAWCMKSELEYEAPDLGTGGEFQQKLDELLAECRRRASALAN